MPYTIYKIPHENKKQVVNNKTGEIHTYKTTYQNAIKQIRLMGMMAFKVIINYIFLRSIKIINRFIEYNTLNFIHIKLFI